jgi:hypothetical protein
MTEVGAAAGASIELGGVIGACGTDGCGVVGVASPIGPGVSGSGLYPRSGSYMEAPINCLGHERVASMVPQSNGSRVRTL